MLAEGALLLSHNVLLSPSGSVHVSEVPEDDFAALFAASIKAKRFQNGQTVEGTIVAIGPEVAFVDIGTKGEATLAIGELTGEDGVVEAKVGDRIQATVVETKGGITLSRKLQRGAATVRQLEDAFRSGLPVEGKVDAEVKGGFSVSIAGLRAFCPFSQIDTVRGTEPASHIGRVYTFRIIELAEGGRKFVVSRRVLLEAEQQARADEVRRALAVGAIVTGRVVSIREFGAFIDLGGGVQGLLHVSEMGWSHVTNPAAVVEPGQEVTVKVLRIDEGTQQVALGMKQLLADPWAAVPATFQAGQAYPGRVERHATFGVFVELASGIVGLVPLAETGVPRESDLRKALPVGSPITVVVQEIDEANRRIRLSRRAVADAEEAAQVRDYAARQDASAPQSFGGSLADKLRGALDRKG
jgi:small subunit ribosomal protein S1